MTLGEIKDQVREHFGRVGWPTVMLDFALDSARRDIEKFGNFYWMKDSKDFNASDGTASYPLTSGTINEPLFKDIRALHIKETTETLWSPLEVGNMPLEEAYLIYDTDSTAEDMPEVGIVENATLYLFPVPDTTYNMRLFFYGWTENAGNTDSDELTNRFPEALIYGALVWGCSQYEKSHPEADRWRALFGQELNKIQRHDFEREQPTQFNLEPKRGPYDRKRYPGSRYL